jgi:hypothetical protein
MVDMCTENSAIKSHLQLVGGWTSVPVSGISNLKKTTIFFPFEVGKGEGYIERVSNMV